MRLRQRKLDPCIRTDGLITKHCSLGRIVDGDSDSQPTRANQARCGHNSLRIEDVEQFFPTMVQCAQHFFRFDPYIIEKYGAGRHGVGAELFYFVVTYSLASGINNEHADPFSTPRHLDRKSTRLNSSH